jgi:hypothetical protein
MDPAEPPPTPSHRRLRRLGTGLLTVAIALGGVILLLLFFEGRDSSQVHSSTDTATGPGQLFPDQGTAHLQPGQKPSRAYASDPPTSGPHVSVAIRSDRAGMRIGDDQLLSALELGDVVLLYGDPTPPAALVALQRRIAGPFDPALAAAGQAIVLARRPGTTGVVAVAWRHLLRTPSPQDPALTQFATYWLGRGPHG